MSNWAAELGRNNSIIDPRIWLLPPFKCGDTGKKSSAGKIKCKAFRLQRYIGSGPRVNQGDSCDTIDDTSRAVNEIISGKFHLYLGNFPATVFSLMKVPTCLKLGSLSTKLITDGQCLQWSLMPLPPLSSRKTFIFCENSLTALDTIHPGCPHQQFYSLSFAEIFRSYTSKCCPEASRAEQSPASCTALCIFIAKRTSLAVLIRVLFSKVRVSICVKFCCGRNLGNDHPPNHKCHSGRNVFLQTLAWIKPDLLRRCQKQTPRHRREGVYSYFVQRCAQPNRLYTRESRCCCRGRSVQFQSSLSQNVQLSIVSRT